MMLKKQISGKKKERYNKDPEFREKTIKSSKEKVEDKKNYTKTKRDVRNNKKTCQKLHLGH